MVEIGHSVKESIPAAKVAESAESVEPAVKG